MLLLGAGLMTCLAPFADVRFLGSSLSFMMVYLWGRRHPYMQLSFLGVFTFTAPYLPWVLLAFSVLLGHSPAVDLLGMAAGHAYFFLEDVYPRMAGGARPLRTPRLLAALFPRDEPIAPLQVPRPQAPQAPAPQPQAPPAAAAGQAAAAAGAAPGEAGPHDREGLRQRVAAAWAQ